MAGLIRECLNVDSRERLQGDYAVKMFEDYFGRIKDPSLIKDVAKQAVGAPTCIQTCLAAKCEYSCSPELTKCECPSGQTVGNDGRGCITKLQKRSECLNGKSEQSGACLASYRICVDDRWESKLCGSSQAFNALSGKCVPKAEMPGCPEFKVDTDVCATCTTELDCKYIPQCAKCQLCKKEGAQCSSMCNKPSDCNKYSVICGGCDFCGRECMTGLCAKKADCNKFASLCAGCDMCYEREDVNPVSVTPLKLKTLFPEPSVMGNHKTPVKKADKKEKQKKVPVEHRAIPALFSGKDGAVLDPKVMFEGEKEKNFCSPNLCKGKPEKYCRSYSLSCSECDECQNFCTMPGETMIRSGCVSEYKKCQSGGTWKKFTCKTGQAVDPISKTCKPEALVLQCKKVNKVW